MLKIDILNNAIEYNNYEELDTIVRSIEDYDGQPVKLDNENLKDFCLNQLNLDLRSRSDHPHIYSNVLSQYKFNQEEFKYDYSVKELVLLAIAANDKLVEQHQVFLFAEENLSLLPLLVGNEQYVKAFIEKFCDMENPYELYKNLKNQTIQLEGGQIGFFSVIALRQEQNLLSSVLIEYVLKDLEQVLQTSSFDPLYGVLETASLAKNKDFMKIVLDSLERCIDDQTKKDLLKKCIVTFLETAISQEHDLIVEYLCRERIKKKGPIIQEVYKEAFADEKIIEQIKNQVLKNIDSADNERKKKKQEIYDLVLQAASYTGSTGFIIKVLDLIKNDPKFSNDIDKQTFLQKSLVTILDNVIREKHSSIIQNVYTNFILKLAENSGEEFLTIQQRYQNACHTSISVDNNIAGQFNEEPNGDDSNLEQDEFQITDIQEEQRPGILGPNKTEIAGFSQEKLLEIINFVKVGYYVSDYNLNNKKFSELEKRSYKVPAKLKEEGYEIIQFYNVRDNGQSYRHAGYVFMKDKEITIAYRGSRNVFDYMKDFEIILTSSDGLLPEGGKIHSGFYSLFKDSWDSVYEILRGYANDQQLEIKDFKINLTGHSMGGAIANIAALCLSVREGAEDLHVATFASPRVFDPSAAKVYEERLGKKTIRVVNQSDPIPSLLLGSMGYKHVGEQLRVKSDSYTHSLDAYRNLTVNIEPDKFKSDNSVSIYYPFSCLIAGLYNTLTTIPSYLIQNTHSNDEQHFKQVKNKHKDASFSEMMKYSGSSNEQEVVIYEDSEPGEDWSIIFHTPRNAIGEKNLLTIPPTFNPNIEHRITRSLIAFFVNNNYYLSGDTISLRIVKFTDQSISKDFFNLSKILVDNYPRSLALMKKEKKSNKLNGGSSSTAAISTLTIAEVSSTNSSLGDHSNNNVQIAVQSDENQQMNAEKAGSSNTPGIPEQILVPSNEKELAASTGYGMGDVITKTGNARNLRVATLGTQQVVPRGGTVSTIEALKNLPNNRTIKIFLLNDQSVAQIFKKSDREVEFSFSNGNTYELNLHLINEESLKVLFNKENSVLANAINDFSTVKMPILEQKSGKNEQAPIQLAGHVIREDSIQVVQPKSLVNIRDNNVQLVNESDQPIQNDNVVASVSSDDNHSDSSKIQLDESRTGSDQVSNQSTGHITKMDNEQAPLSEGNSKLESDQQDPQPEVLPIVLNGNPNNIAVTNENVKMPTPEQKSDTKTNDKQSANPNNVGVTAPSVQPAPPKSVDKNSGKKDTQSKSTGVHLVASKNPKRVNNAQGNSKQPSYNPAPQNARSKLPVIAASMLAITGVATGIAIAVYLEMLMVGIAVGACCLVAAAIIYYCNKPLNSLEESSVNKFTDREELTV
ncbi:lipase family protein [Wolbachia endosymbiont (group A) of Beris morrisii]|uniref:host RNA manipulator TomO n=1 Tax=Wolbachia endosymbiont (group A) of Beris morrisii TaxID=3066139 RepID=UPI00333E19BA